MRQIPPGAIPQTGEPHRPGTGANIGADVRIDANEHTGMDSGDSDTNELDFITLCAIKERHQARQPVSQEMIDQAFANLFSVDSHDAFHRPESADTRSRSTLRNWLKKPTE